MKRNRFSASMCGGLLAVTLIVSIESRGDDAERRARESPDPGSSATECAQLPGLIDQVECFTAAATQAGRPVICRAAEHEGVRYQCIAIVAERLKDASLCDEIPASSEEARGLRDLCLSDLSVVLEDSSLCGKIRTVGLQDSCCLKVARDTGDLPLCDQIEDAGLRSHCRGQPTLVE